MSTKKYKLLHNMIGNNREMATETSELRILLKFLSLHRLKTSFTQALYCAVNELSFVSLPAQLFSWLSVGDSPQVTQNLTEGNVDQHPGELSQRSCRCRSRDPKDAAIVNTAENVSINVLWSKREARTSHTLFDVSKRSLVLVVTVLVAPKDRYPKSCRIFSCVQCFQPVSVVA